MQPATHARFVTTDLSLLAAIADGSGPRRDRALDALVQRIWPRVYAAARRLGRDPEAAAELTQGFFADVVLGRNLLAHADADRGRLRWLLLRALKHYAVDRHRRRAARRPTRCCWAGRRTSSTPRCAPRSARWPRIRRVRRARSIHRCRARWPRCSPARSPRRRGTATRTRPSLPPTCGDGSTHPSTFETLIEIRDADGRRVHRAWWHPGHVYPQSVALVADEAGEPLIVAAGIANRLAAGGEVLPVTADAQETRVVFALRPEAPSGMLPVWLVPEGEERERGADDRDGPGAGSSGLRRARPRSGTAGSPRRSLRALRCCGPRTSREPPCTWTTPRGGSLHLMLDGRPVAVVWPDGVTEPPYTRDDVRRLDPADAVAPGLD